MILLASLLLAAGCAGRTPPADAPVEGHARNGLAPGELAAPEDDRLRAYLGIEAGKSFRLDDIQADILLVEVFDMYCPHCQREAPNVNRLYRHIAADPRLAERVKLIGIGIGNTAYEVGLFAKTFDVPFPLFADRGRYFVHALTIRRTPTFVGFARNREGRLDRILHTPGPLGDVDLFLERLLRSADQARQTSSAND